MKVNHSNLAEIDLAEISLAGRVVGPAHPPLIIAEIGINHEGSLDRALEMVEAAAATGCECVKLQCHVIEDEMAPAAQEVIPGNADESIWSIMARCALDEPAERQVMARCRELGMIYLSTPFSRAAADRLEGMGVELYKIGSGECNNTPLIEHIAAFGKPVILSTGMNDLASVRRSAAILERKQVPFALLHCTSIYPTPYDKVRLGAMAELQEVAACPIGLSDHSLGIWTCLGAVALGASILEKHFTLRKDWPGPDVPISIDPQELGDLIEGSRAIWMARGGSKEVLAEEQPTIDFAYSSVCTIQPVASGEQLSRDNTWVKRPGTGDIPAARFDEVLGRRVVRDLPVGALVSWDDLEA